MKVFLKFLAVLLIIAALGGLVYFVVTNDNAMNWFMAAAIGGVAAYIAAMFLGMVMSAFTPMFGDDSESVQNIVTIFVWLVAIAGGIYLTILVARTLIH